MIVFYDLSSSDGVVCKYFLSAYAIVHGCINTRQIVKVTIILNNTGKLQTECVASNQLLNLTFGV